MLLRFRASLTAVLFLLLVLAGGTVSAYAQSLKNPSGLPLPRFATTRSQPVNVRVGPGTNYEIAWVYVKAGQPVEIIQEFDTWRKIRDREGDEGWIHQNLLSGARVGFITPLVGSDDTPMYARANEASPVRAWLPPQFKVGIEACEENWCEVTAQGPEKTYKGYVDQSVLWGTYANEEF